MPEVDDPCPECEEPLVLLKDQTLVCVACAVEFETSVAPIGNGL
jgi:uncharacterized Zn finger protein (UPF0148 family)